MPAAVLVRPGDAERGAAPADDPAGGDAGAPRVGEIGEDGPRRYPRLRGAGRWAAGLAKFDITGVFFATLFLCWSLTPSLLPRGWLYQGLIGGISAALGYGVGLVAGWAVRRVYLDRRPWWPLRRPRLHAVRVAVVLVCVVATIGMLILSSMWQRDLAALMGEQGASAGGYIRAGLVTVGVLAAVVTAARLLRDAAVGIGRVLSRRTGMPRAAAVAMGSVAVAAIVLVVVDEVLLRVTEGVTNRIFSANNEATPPGIEQPLQPERSGSGASLIPWDTLGYEGRYFVARGWRQDELQRQTGEPAKQPIRLYVGLDSAPTPQDRMRLLREEIARTGAFDREAVIVIPTTGTGWVNPTAAQAIELMYGGDTAIIASQYSYKPSAVSFLTDRDAAAEAGKRLIDTVHDEYEETVAGRPDGDRPELYVYGESLGVTAGEGAFESLADVRETVDGVLWVGPPNSSRLWRSIVTRRDPGTDEIEPTYAGGLVVRFANDAEDIRADELQEARGQGTWLKPRVLYIQHPSDPVVWWSTDLLLHRPAWLSETPGYDRLEAMRWFPLVTFWQVSADLAMAADVPDGHGHNYGTQMLDGWAAVAAPPGWTDGDTERTRVLLQRARDHQGPEK
ncbi:alpha/beta hydrolase [Tomitella fengzijianii]|uniref:alpha/beta hydrolase n=1 Tax=Tomitella fengzijianii TaxID=2597660 RepID=UPI0020BEB227|nr:alpha/beta hydrolase [Tomitella fengzijianii]